MAAPTVSATCGVPVTVAASSKSTVTRISSPARKTPRSADPVPERDTPVTAGPRVSAALPLTVKSARSRSACVPRPSAAALPAASAIAAPFRVSAEAVTLIPFASVSPEATV